jgi:hypothetical protein
VSAGDFGKLWIRRTRTAAVAERAGESHRARVSLAPSGQIRTGRGDQIIGEDGPIRGPRRRWPEDLPLESCKRANTS